MNKIVGTTKMKGIPEFTTTLIKLVNQTWFLSNFNVALSKKNTNQFLEDLHNHLVFDALNVDTNNVLIPIYNGLAIYTNNVRPEDTT